MFRRLALIDTSDGSVINTAHEADFKNWQEAEHYLERQREAWLRQDASATWGDLVIMRHGKGHRL
jgi:hypothetical protein